MSVQRSSKNCASQTDDDESEDEVFATVRRRDWEAMKAATPKSDQSSSATGTAVHQQQSLNVKIKRSKKISPIPMTPFDSTLSTQQETLRNERDFMNYVMSLSNRSSSTSTPESIPGSRSDSVMSHSTNANLGLLDPSTTGDHIDDLYYLMAELGQLKNANNRLQRKVEQLEAQSNKQRGVDTAVRPSGLHKAQRRAKNVKKSKSHASLNDEQMTGLNRERSKSVGHEGIDSGGDDDDVKKCDSKNKLEKSTSTRRFPNWSRFKEALGLDKTGATVRSASSSRIADEERVTGGKMGDRKVLNKNEPRSKSKDGRLGLSDVQKSESFCFPNEGNFDNWINDEYGYESEKSSVKPSSSTSSRGPWNKMKTMIQTRRGSTKKKSCLISGHKSQPNSTTQLTATPSTSNQNISITESRSMTDIYNRSTPSTPVTGETTVIDEHHRRHSENPGVTVTQESSLKYQRRPETTITGRLSSMSPPVQRRSKWNKMKKNFGNANEGPAGPLKLGPLAGDLVVPSLPSSATSDASFTYDDQSVVPPDGSSKPLDSIVQALQRNLSEDFHKKIAEWEQMRMEANMKMTTTKSPSTARKRPPIERNRSSSKIYVKTDEKIPIKDKVKDITWLEKQLAKVERERTRLSKEQAKVDERAARLVKLRQTVLETDPKKEILVRTAAGEFRFHGINQDFTKKLYEWEAKHGKTGDSSTLALLGDGETVSPVSAVSIVEPQSNETDETARPLTRLISRSVDRLPIKTGSTLRSHSLPSFTGQQMPIESCDKKAYIGLLKSNMFLLEKLKDKEEICRQLENELKTADKIENIDEKNQRQIRCYADKLSEVDHIDPKPRNLANSLKMIADLKERVEQLQRCSEQLKADKEALEESFKYHSEQQTNLTIELIEKMRELQQISFDTNSTGKDDVRPKRKRKLKCEVENVDKLHDLTTRLLQQARDLEFALVERTRQICRLRWELLNRDVSTMRLQTELQTAQWEQKPENMTAASNLAALAKRSQYGQRRSWSSSEKLNLNRIQRAIEERPQPSKFGELSMSDWPKIDYKASNLSATVQLLKVELLKLSAAQQLAEMRDDESGASSGIKPKDDQNKILEKKPRSILTSIGELLPDYGEYYDDDEYESSHDGGVGHSSSDRLSIGRHHRSHDHRPLIRQTSFTRRRSSADATSSVSGGADNSESSSLADNEHMCVLRLPRHRYRRSRDQISSSSESSFIEEENFSTLNWVRGGATGGVEKPIDGSRGHVSEANSVTSSGPADSWPEIYKSHTTSSSAFTEGVEASSESAASTSGHAICSPDSALGESTGACSVTGGAVITAAARLGQLRSSVTEERRHSDPCRVVRVKYGARNDATPAIRQLVIEDKSPSPIVYTLSLKNNSNSNVFFEKDTSSENTFHHVERDSGNERQQN